MKAAMRFCITCVLSGASLVNAQDAAAGVVVIVHPSNATASLTGSDVQKIYLGKMKHFPDGKPLTPVDQKDTELPRQLFYQQIVRRDGAQLKAYWAKIVFTGDGVPPESKGDSASVKAWVASHPDAVGYIDESQLDPTVKSVFRLP